MDIDIYARWRTQTEEEQAAQITGFSTVHGHVGYLREAYHGAPYATRFLVREAFESETHEAAIPAAVLRAITGNAQAGGRARAQALRQPLA